MNILIRPLDTKTKNERPRCPEVGLGILDFVVRTVRPALGKHAKCIGLFVLLAHREKRSDVDAYHG